MVKSTRPSNILSPPAPGIVHAESPLARHKAWLVAGNKEVRRWLKIPLSRPTIINPASGKAGACSCPSNRANAGTVRPPLSRMSLHKAFFPSLLPMYYPPRSERSIAASFFRSSGSPQFKDPRPIISAIYHMINRTSIFNTHRPRHVGQKSSFDDGANVYLSDLAFFSPSAGSVTPTTARVPAPLFHPPIRMCPNCPSPANPRVLSMARAMGTGTPTTPRTLRTAA